MFQSLNQEYFTFCEQVCNLLIIDFVTVVNKSLFRDRDAFFDFDLRFQHQNSSVFNDRYAYSLLLERHVHLDLKPSWCVLINLALSQNCLSSNCAPAELAYFWVDYVKLVLLFISERLIDFLIVPYLDMRFTSFKPCQVVFKWLTWLSDLVEAVSKLTLIDQLTAASLEVTLAQLSLKLYCVHDSDL